MNARQQLEGLQDILLSEEDGQVLDLIDGQLLNAHQGLGDIVVAPGRNNGLL